VIVIVIELRYLKKFKNSSIQKNSSTLTFELFVDAKGFWNYVESMQTTF